MKRQRATNLDTGLYVVIAITQLCYGSAKAALDNTSTNEYAYLPIKLYLYPLKFVLQIIFMSHKMLLV